MYDNFAGDRYWYETIENSKFKGKVDDVENRDKSALFLQAGDKIEYYDGTFGIPRHKRSTRIVWIRVSSKDVKNPKYLMELENRARYDFLSLRNHFAHRHDHLYSLEKSLRVLRLEDHEGNKVSSSWEQLRKHLLLKSEMKGMDEIINQKTKALVSEGISEIRNSDSVFGMFAKDSSTSKKKSSSKLKKKTNPIVKKKKTAQLKINSFFAKKTPKTKSTKKTKSPQNKSCFQNVENLKECDGDFETLVWESKKRKSFVKKVNKIDDYVVRSSLDSDSGADAFVEDDFSVSDQLKSPSPISKKKKSKKKKKKKKENEIKTPNSTRTKTPSKKRKTPLKGSKTTSETPSKKRKTPSKKRKTPSKRTEKIKTPSSKKKQAPSKMKKKSTPASTNKKKRRAVKKKMEALVIDDSSDDDGDWSDDENGTISFMGATIARS